MTRTPSARARLARLFPFVGLAALAAALTLPTPARAAGADFGWSWSEADSAVYSDSGICVHPYLTAGSGWISTGYQTFKLEAAAYGDVRLTDSCAPNAKPVVYGAHSVAMRIIYWYWDGNSWVIYQNSDWFYDRATSDPAGDDIIDPLPELAGIPWAVTFEAFIYRPPGPVRSGTRYFDGSPFWKGGYVMVGPFIM